MGFVYKAWHPGFNDFVALKTIQDARLEGQELLERFKLEGQALAKLKHQNIVQIYDADQADGVHFIVMEFMNGGSLERIITRRETVALARRVGYLVPVCHALNYAHKRGLFHRDIKPANIMLHIDGSEEIVKVVDFGIARLVDSSHTQTKVRIGSPYYMAPELITASAKANEKTDIWALGVTLYELIAYQRPFEGNDAEELARNIVRGPHKPLTQIVPDCPKDLSSVVEKTLQKDPSSRYQTVEDLLFELEPIAKRLRTDVAGSLVRRAKDLLEIGEFESAKSALDEARKYDSANQQARSLLQKVVEELRRKDLLPRLQEDLKLGRKFMGFGQYREAKVAAEHAIGLDSRFEPAHKLLAEIQEAEAIAEEVQQKLSYAQRCVSEGELTDASRTVDEVLAVDADNREAIDLSTKIRNRREELERRKKLNQFLRSAEDLHILGKYDECLALVEQALSEFPENAGLQKLKEDALAEKSEQLRQSLLNTAKKLRISQQFDQALKTLDDLLVKFPKDSAGILLRSSIQKDRDQEHLNKQLGLAWEELRSLKHQGKFTRAFDLAQELIVKFPAEGRLREFARELEAEIRLDQMHAQLDAAVNKIQGSMRDGQYSQAIRASEDALKIFPENALLASLLKEGKSQQQHERVREKQDEYVSRVRQLISEGQPKVAAELARKALAEFGQHPGLHEAFEEAERGYASQVEKARQRDTIAAEIQAWCEKGDIRAATRIFQNAVKDGVIETKTSLHATLIQNINGAREKEEKDRQLDVEVNNVQGLIRDGHYSEAIRASKDALKIFPDNALLASLFKEANSQQQRKELHEKQDEYVSKVRQLISGEQFKAAAEVGRRAIGELGEHPRLREALGQAERCYALQLEKAQQREAVAAEIEASCKQGDIGSATRIFQSAVKEGVIETKTSLHATLIQNIKGAEEKAQKDREAQLERKRSNVAQAVDRKDYSTAIRLANELERDFGFDRHASDLRRAAESGLENERIARQEHDEVLQRVSVYLKSGNVAAADQMLRNSSETGILKDADPQVVALLGTVKELLDRDKERKKKLQGIARDLRESLQAGNFARVIESGENALNAEGHDEGIADLVKQAKIRLAREETLQKRRLAELRSIRGLLDDGNSLQARKVLEDALRQGVLDRNARDVVGLRSEVDESVRAIVERPATAGSGSADDIPLVVAPTKTGSSKLLIGALATIVLAAVVCGAVYFGRRGSQPPLQLPPRDDDQMYWDKAESAMNRSPRDFKEALAEYEKVAGLHGSHRSLAQHQIDDIETWQSKEESLLQQAQDAMNKPQPDYPAAIQLFEDVVKIDGDRRADAESMLKHAEDLSKGKDPTMLAEQDLNDADQLLVGRQWQDARRLYQQVKQSPGLPANFSSRATVGFEKANSHVNEEQLWKLALAAENDNRLTDALSMFEKIAAIKLDHKADAQSHIRGIDSRISAEKAKAEESNRETAWLELNGRIGQLQDSQDKVKLLAAQQELKPYMSRSSPHNAEATDLNRAIADNLVRLDAEESWKNVLEQYKQALNANDKTSLGQIANKLKQFMNGGPHAQDAKEYADNISKVLAAPDSTPHADVLGANDGSKESSEKLSARDQNDIGNLLDRFGQAMGTKDLKTIKAVWPGIPKDKLEIIKKSNIQIRFTDAKYYREPDGRVRIDCTQTVEQLVEGKRLTSSTPHFHLYAVQRSGQWQIEFIPLND